MENLRLMEEKIESGLWLWCGGRSGIRCFCILLGGGDHALREIAMRSSSTTTTSTTPRSAEVNLDQSVLDLEVLRQHNKRELISLLNGVSRSFLRWFIERIDSLASEILMRERRLV